MSPSELKAHKLAPKQLKEVPKFSPQKRNKLQKPLKGIGGPRILSTGLLNVSDEHTAFMFCKDGQIITDRAFYGYLFCRLASGELSPIFEFHWHPSHKGFHCKMPCRTNLDYTGRLLPGAPELNLKSDLQLDPKIPIDRQKLVIEFCRLCNIKLPDNDSNSMRLWK
jgi:hypothetical protein